MKTINEIKNEVSLEQGYTSYLDVFEFAYALCDEVAKRYALEAVKADRERVSENAKIAFHCGTTKITHSISHYQSGADNIQIDKESILNLPYELP